jgi:hypothetical protein
LVKVVAELAKEQQWSNFKNEPARFQGAAGGDYVHALHRVWDVMYGLQASEREGQRARGLQKVDRIVF